MMTVPPGPTPSQGDPDAQVFVISVAAQLAGMHAQTLRTYDRLGLVTPHRTTGGGRRYSPRDVALLREVQRLSQDEGVNLAGIKRRRRRAQRGRHQAHHRADQSGRSAAGSGVRARPGTRQRPRRLPARSRSRAAKRTRGVEAAAPALRSSSSLFALLAQENGQPDPRRDTKFGLMSRSGGS